MPYNLRKRPQPAVKVEPVKKRPRASAKKDEKKVDKKEKNEEKQNERSEQLEECVKHEEQQGEKQEEIQEVKKKFKKEDKKDVKKEDKKQEKKVEKHLQGSNLLIFGSDSCGELGQGKIGFNRKEPTAISLDIKVAQVAAGPMHVILLTQDGQIFTHGCNDEGALGRETDGDEESEATPTLVPLEDKVIKVTAGDSHSAVLTNNKKVFIWGNFRDEHGSIGLTPECDGQSTIKHIPIMPDTEFQDIASGSNHMLLLDVNGKVYSFGVGAQGQLGRIKPGENEVKITSDNSNIFLVPHEVDLKNVDPSRPFICDAIYAGNFTSFATNSDHKKNRLAGWGLNNYYQLGYKGQKGQLVQHAPKRSTFTCSTRMSQVACGQHHTLFLTKTGRVYSSGRNTYGMLGLGKVGGEEICPAKPVEDLGNTIKTISVGINTSFAVNNEGELFAWGMGGLNLGLEGDDDAIKPVLVKRLKGRKITSVSAGSSFTAVLVENSNSDTD